MSLFSFSLILELFFRAKDCPSFSSHQCCRVMWCFALHIASPSIEGTGFPLITSDGYYSKKELPLERMWGGNSARKHQYEMQILKASPALIFSINRKFQHTPKILHVLISPYKHKLMGNFWHNSYLDLSSGNGASVYKLSTSIIKLQYFSYFGKNKTRCKWEAYIFTSLRKYLK